MPHQNMDQWREGLKSPNRVVRESSVADIAAKLSEISGDEFAEIIGLLERDPSPGSSPDDRMGELRFQVRSALRLLAARPWAPELPSALRDWFFAPFRPRLPGTTVSNPCVAIGICDQEHIRDVQAQHTLGRYFSRDRFPDTEFFYVPLNNPGWSEIEFSRTNAFSFTGRPGMFNRCPVLLALFDQHQNRRFSMPEDDENWRSHSVSTASAEVFHHVVQQPPIPGSLAPKFRVAEVNGYRTDYAVIQRFRVYYSGRFVTVIILAGTTSLGTMGAVEWATSSDMPSHLEKACSRFGKSLNEDTQIEILLRVTAEVRQQERRPWKTIEKTPMKLFLDDCVNPIMTPLSIRRRIDQLPGPGCVTLVRRDGKTEVFLDDDKVMLEGNDFSNLVTICSAAHQSAGNKSSLLRLDSIPSGSIAGYTGSSINDLKIFLRDHLQRHVLGGAIEFQGPDIRFHCGIRVIDHSLLPPAGR